MASVFASLLHLLSPCMRQNPVRRHPRPLVAHLVQSESLLALQLPPLPVFFCTLFFSWLFLQHDYYHHLQNSLSQHQSLLSLLPVQDHQPCLNTQPRDLALQCARFFSHQAHQHGLSEY